MHLLTISANLREVPEIILPQPIIGYTTARVLAMEFIPGTKVTELTRLERREIGGEQLVDALFRAYLKQILRDGLFHADPHPGNVFYVPGNRIVIIDFGMVGRLSPQRRAQVIDLLGGLARMAEEPMLDVLMDWAGDAYVDEVKLAADVNEMVFDYEGVPLKDIRVGHAIRQFAAIVREHSIVLPSDLSLMFKALITLEGLGRQYDPDFHITEHLTPLVKSALAERYQPNELMRRGRNAVTEFINVVGGVPRDFARFLREARRGKTRIDLDLKRLDSFGRQLDRTLDRVTVGIMTASLVIGSAIVLTVQDGPTFLGIPVLPGVGLFGYLLAFLNSVWIVYGIWRSGRE
jgi:ubiquinone biosynthesis protein